VLVNHRILIVEDDPHFGRQLADLFDFLGFEPHVAASGPEGVSAFEAGGMALVLTDLMLPLMNGVEVVRRIRALPGGDVVPVLMMSAVYKNPKMFEKELRELGILEFLAKPFSLIDLGRKVSTLLDDDVGEVEAGITETGSWRVEELDSMLDEDAPEFDPDGPFEAVRLIAIVAELFRGHGAGRLELKRGGTRRELFFLNGHPVWATSEEPAEDLLSVLVELGRLAPHHAGEIHGRAAQQGRSPREVLVASGLVGQHSILEAERERVRRVFVGAFAGGEGTYAFEAGDGFVDAVPVHEVNPLPLLLSAVERHVALERVEADLSGMHDHFVGFGPRFARMSAYFEPAVELRPTVELIDTGASVLEMLVDAGERRDQLAPWLWLLLRLQVLSAEDPRRASGSHLLSVERTGDSFSTGELAPPRFLPEEEPVREVDPAIEALLAEYLSNMDKDFYSFLGVPRDAHKIEIRLAVAERRERYAPGSLPGGAPASVRTKAQELTQRLDKAWGTLADEARRAIYDEMLDRREDRLRADRRQRRDAAEALLRAGDPAAAEDELRVLLVEAPGDGRVMGLLGQALLLDGAPERVDEARPLLEQAAELRPKDAPVLRALAEACRRQGDAGGLSAAAARLRRVDPADPWLRSRGL
jgi:CheY-like chemotaxis protein